jgi:hypothetical protein
MNPDSAPNRAVATTAPASDGSEPRHSAWRAPSRRIRFLVLGGVVLVQTPGAYVLVSPLKPTGDRQTVAIEPVAENGRLFVRQPAPATNRFYRLKFP